MPDNAERKSAELALLLSFEKFLKEKSPGDNFDIGYQIGERLAKELKYTKSDLENVVGNLYQGDDLSKPYVFHKNFLLRFTYEKSIGVYISALVNKIIGEYPLNLHIRTLLQGIGCFQKKGTLVVYGSVGKMAGYKMEGGLLVINGNTSWGTGYDMTGGKLIVNGTPNHISKSCKGIIYQCDKQVWPAP